MTTQHQTIAFCVLALLAIPVGGFTTYKLINRLTRPPVNTLVRPGDIELDYIEPTLPGHTYQPIDLENTHFINLESISNWRDRVPSYFT